MLLKQNRLKKKKDFETVFKQGKGFRQDFLFLKVRNNELNVPRFGFVVSSKVSNKAVVRNRIKRRLREIMRNMMIEIKNPVDGVFVTFPGIEQKSFQDLEKTINQLLKKANLI